MDYNVSQIYFDAGNNKKKKYKVKTIYNSVIYAKKSEDYLLKLYLLIFQKKYSEKKNT